MGGGGDGGYSARQDEQERRKQEARDALNVRFGVQPSAATVNRNDFITPGTYDPGSDVAGSGSATSAPGFDQAGYEAALARAEQARAEAAANQSQLADLYSGVRQSAFDVGRRRLDDENTARSRDLRFELLARGLGGGSVDVDQNALLGRIYGEGLADIGAKADSTATALRTSDETTRLGLLQSIDAGMDQGSAMSSALAQMKNNADRASAAAQGVTFGDIFDNVGLLYGRDRRAQGQRRAAEDWNIFSSRPSRASTSGSPTGIATNAYDG